MTGRFPIQVNKAKDERKNKLLLLAVTIHNIPEGIAVGVAFAGAIFSKSEITMASALTLAIGIAIQNLPEGAIISMPIKANGKSKSKAFLIGVLSGAVEPIFSTLAIVFARIAVPVLPYLLSFAAGAMIYVVVQELVPEMQENTNSKIGVVALALGFCTMMALDVALG